MAYPYLSEEDSLADLDSRITGDDRDVFKNYGHLRIEPAFDNRLFLIYKPTGLTREGRHRDPEILPTIKILRLDLNSREGAICTIADQSTGAKMDLGYIPRRVFHYNLFMAVPPILRLRWNLDKCEIRWTATAAAAGANVAQMGEAVLDFGAAPGTNIATVTISGLTDLKSSSKVDAWLMAAASADQG